MFNDNLKPAGNPLFDQVVGSLLLRPNFVAKSEISRREDRVPAWKAGTLPTELLPQNKGYFKPDFFICQSVVYIIQ